MLISDPTVFFEENLTNVTTFLNSDRLYLLPLRRQYAEIYHDEILDENMTQIV